MVRSKETRFIRSIKGRLYLIHRYYEGMKRRERAIPISSLSSRDRVTLETALKIKVDLANQVVDFPCMNPACTGTVKMTKTQLDDFFVSYKKKYDMVVLPFCCRECRDKVLQHHGVTVDE